MSNAWNNNHINYCIRIIQLMEINFENYQQLRAILVRQIQLMDAQYDPRRDDEHDEHDQGDHDDTDMEDVVMGGTSLD
ncbi:hypothetical protein ACHAO4_001463 [Trichoderma viride]